VREGASLEQGPRRRIEVSPERPPVVLEGRVWNELRAHARETWPEECCGLVTGPALGSYRALHRCRNDLTRLHRQDPLNHPRDGRHGFFMNELDYLRVREEARQRGEIVTAVYHSHVGTGVYFSELDQEYAGQEFFPFPAADHIVIAVVEGRVGDVGLFRRAAPGVFEGRAVAPEPA
jgi:proteasome lid subunit RPN8/RPN11